MSNEKKDWRSRICSVCSMRNTEHCNPCVVIAIIGDELTREDIIRAEEAEKYKALVEAVKNKFQGNPCIYCIDNDDPTCNCADKQLYTAYISLERSNENG